MSAKRKRGRPPRDLPQQQLTLPQCQNEDCGSLNTYVHRSLMKFEGYLRNIRRCAVCKRDFEAVWKIPEK
jgi:hypothetical protein